MDRKQDQAIEDRLVQIPLGHVQLEGSLNVPEDAEGIVVFVHGSGSSRHSPRNQFVAKQLRQGPLGTLLFDLLTSEEEEIDMRTGRLRFDIGLLAERTIAAVEWLSKQDFAEGLETGLFGASTGAAAALITAAERPDRITAVVSRGGRPDMAEGFLQRVQAPTLLIVGGQDSPVIEMNQEAFEQMSPDLEKEFRIVPGATHLFSEPGALEQVAEMAQEWFTEHLTSQEE